MENIRPEMVESVVLEWFNEACGNSAPQKNLQAAPADAASHRHD
jgi:hypothetical protein